MADLRGQKLKDSYQNVVTDSGSDLAGIENGNGVDITARIVERDSNSDGEWVRFADGTQIIITNLVNIGHVDITEGELFRSATLDIDYPQQFDELPFVEVYVDRDGSGNVNLWGVCTMNLEELPATLSFARSVRVLCAGVRELDTFIRIKSTGNWK